MHSPYKPNPWKWSKVQKPTWEFQLRFSFFGWKFENVGGSLGADKPNAFLRMIEIDQVWSWDKQFINEKQVAWRNFVKSKC